MVHITGYEHTSYHTDSFSIDILIVASLLCMLRTHHPLTRPISANATLTTSFRLQLFNQASTNAGQTGEVGWGGCILQGFPVGGGDNLHNLG